MSTCGRIVAASWAGLLLCLSHGWLPGLALFAPIPLLLALRGASVRQAFYIGLLCGAAETLVVAGISYAGVPLYVGMCITFALARIAFTLSYVLLRAELFALSGAVTASLWALVEWLHSEIPYSAPSILGNTQHVGPFLPLARLGGAYLISFCIVWISTGLVQCALRYHAERRWKAAVRPLFIPVVVTLLLRVAADLAAPTLDARVRVTVVQGGLPTWLYSRADENSQWAHVPLSVYQELTRTAESSMLTVWPETAVWRLWGKDAEYERILNRMTDSRGAMLIGVPYRDLGGAWINGAVHLRPGHEAELVDKRRLALLAEHRFTPGQGEPIIDVGEHRGGVVFCLESVVPQYASGLARRGATLLFVLAEGSRFGATQVSRMHAQYSVLRAVETGRSVVHAGQHGYSTIISPYGTRRAPLAPFHAESFTEEVAVSHFRTPFVRFGGWVFLPAGLLVWVALMWRLLGRARST